MRAVFGCTAVVVLVSFAATTAVATAFDRNLSSSSERSATGASVRGSVTPAQTLIDTAIRSIPESPLAGAFHWAAAAPYPYTCATEPVPAAFTGAAPITVNGVTATVTVAAYGAGLGAIAYPAVASSVPTCITASDAARISALPLGTEAQRTVLTRNGTVRSTVIGRSGDLLWFVSSADDTVTGIAASRLSQRIGELAAGVCSNLTAPPGDSNRNLLRRDSYTPLSAQNTVAIDAPSLPTVAKGVAVPLTAEIPPLPTAVTADVPVWTVWPRMPEPVTQPQIRKPALEPPLTAAYTELLPDPTGPGCGWAFTGTANPVPNRTALRKANAAARSAAEVTLSKGAAAWKQDVLRFWLAWPKYEQDATAYRAYTAEVDAVNAAWQVINDQWAQHNTALAKYTAANIAYGKKVDAIVKANTDYAAAIVACQNPAPTPTPSPSPSASPAPTPSATAEPAADCAETVPKPKILTDPAPVAPTPPVMPADPRPISEQTAP